MPETGPQDRYAAVKVKLRERGYLDGRIERFVLRMPRSPRGAWSGLLLPAARAGLIAGPLLGAFLAATTASRYPGVMSVPDLLLLWLYLGLLSGAVLVVLNLTAALCLSGLSRWRGTRPGDRFVAAGLATIPLLGYLGWLWWRRGESDANAGDLLFLAGTAALTLFAAWLAGIVSLAGIASSTGDVPARGRRPMLVLSVLVLLPVLALAAARSIYPARSDGVAPSPYTVGPDRSRLLFVGVDGLDTELVQAFESRGALPHLLDGMRAGATFPTRRPEGPEPAEVWTTLLTGMPPQAHGVTSAGAELLPGIATPLAPQTGPLPLEAALHTLLPTTTVPTNVSARQCPTLWEIVSFHMPSAAIGWWASWPAGPFFEEADRGYVVSDRVLPKLLSGAPPDRDTWPASLFDRLRTEFPEDRRRLRAAFLQAFPSAGSEPVAHWIWESFLIDGYAWTLARRLASDDDLDAIFIYLPGLDILRHRLGRGRPQSDLTTLLEMHEALELYVVWLDALLGTALRPEERWQVLLVADPGRQASPQTEGFVVVRGPDAEAACVGPVLSSVDVAPLALSLLRFPLSEEMQGVAPTACIREAAEPIGAVGTFGRRAPRTAPEASPYDPEMVERLRSLGYLN